MLGIVRRATSNQHGNEMINASHLYLSARTIRDGLNGLEHIDAIMRIRGLDPEAVHVPRKNNRRFRNGTLRVAVMDVLRGGSYTAREIADKLGCQYSCVYGCLRTLEAHGVVRREA